MMLIFIWESKRVTINNKCHRGCENTIALIYQGRAVIDRRHAAACLLLSAVLQYHPGYDIKTT